MEDIDAHLTLLTRFSIAMGLILLLPKLMERLRLPGVLGFILAGIVLGPNMFGIVKQDGPVITLLAEIGKLLFMFFVGFEIDLDEFKKSRNRSLVFGALTFLFPLLIGIALGRLTGNGWNSSMLIGSLIASHTLLAFPILQKLGLTGHPAVVMVVGGTIFTDVASMLVLALAVSIHLNGFSWAFLGTEILELAVYFPAVLFGSGKLARKAIIRYGQKPEARVIILLVVIALCAEGAHLIQLEGIVGAFIAGIALKRALRGKFAVEQLEVTAHTLFIPAFFLTTGFLVNFQLLVESVMLKPALVIGLMGALVLGKVLAAWVSTLLFRRDRAETGLVWKLSLPQMAATLAAAVVAYTTVNADGERLLNQTYVNAVLVLVVATCVAGPILAERHAKRMVSALGKEADGNRA